VSALPSPCDAGYVGKHVSSSAWPRDLPARYGNRRGPAQTRSVEGVLAGWPRWRFGPRTEAELPENAADVSSTVRSLSTRPLPWPGSTVPGRSNSRSLARGRQAAGSATEHASAGRLDPSTRWAAARSPQRGRCPSACAPDPRQSPAPRPARLRPPPHVLDIKDSASQLAGARSLRQAAGRGQLMRDEQRRLASSSRRAPAVLAPAPDPPPARCGITAQTVEQHQRPLASPGASPAPRSQADLSLSHGMRAASTGRASSNAAAAAVAPLRERRRKRAVTLLIQLPEPAHAPTPGPARTARLHDVKQIPVNLRQHEARGAVHWRWSISSAMRSAVTTSASARPYSPRGPRTLARTITRERLGRAPAQLLSNPHRLFDHPCPPGGRTLAVSHSPGVIGVTQTALWARRTSDCPIVEPRTAQLPGRGSDRVHQVGLHVAAKPRRSSASAIRDRLRHARR